MSKDLGESVPSGGTDVEPQQNVSSANEVSQASPQSEVTLETVLEKLEAQDKQLRALQGDKDRGVNKALQQVENLSERFAELEPYVQARLKGKTAEDAQREYILEEMVKERMGNKAQVVQDTPGKPTPAPGAEDLDDYFKEFDIDPNGPEAIKFVRAGKFDPASRTKFVLDHSRKQTSTPSPAASMPEGTGASVGARTLDEVNAELQAAMTSPMGLDFDKIKRLEEEHRKLIPTK